MRLGRWRSRPSSTATWPMVLRTCRALLRDSHDAHDAFQATFLVLVRKAGSLWVHDTLGPWLHRVARRTATRGPGWRRLGESGSSGWRSVPAGRSAGDCEQMELGQVIHEELARLPERYRAAVVTCLVDDMTPEQAARQLGWPIGTVHSRLARGRRHLQSRLARRGFLPGSAGLVLALSSEVRAVAPGELVRSTVRSAMDVLTGRAIAEGVSASAAILSEKTLRAMIMSQMRLATGLAFAAGLGLAGLAMLSRPTPGIAQARHHGRSRRHRKRIPLRRVSPNRQRRPNRQDPTGS